MIAVTESFTSWGGEQTHVQGHLLSRSRELEKGHTGATTCLPAETPFCAPSGAMAPLPGMAACLPLSDEWPGVVLALKIKPGALQEVLAFLHP